MNKIEIMYCGEISCEDCSKDKCMYMTDNEAESEGINMVVELVIELPDNLLKGMKIENGSMACQRILDAVYDGKILPKGHGRLIDADALECEPYLVSKGNGMYEEVKGYFNIDDAPTIIEADNEREE